MKWQISYTHTKYSICNPDELDLEVDTPFLWYTMYKTWYTVSDPDRCSSRIVLPDHPVFRGMKFGQQHPVDEHGDLGYDNTEIATQ